MAKVPANSRGAGMPQLKPDVVQGADLLVVTIAGVTFKDSQFKANPQPVLTFVEFPEHELRCGKRATDRLCEKFGDDTDDWEGKVVPLIKVREDVGKDSYIVFQVAPVEDWPELLKRGKAATAAAAKRARK